MDALILSALICGSLLLLCVLQFGFKRIITYQLDINGLAIKIFGGAWVNIALQDIADVQKWSQIDYPLLLSYNYVNRLFGPYVWIRTRKGLVKNYIISPDSAEAMVERFRNLCQA